MKLINSLSLIHNCRIFQTILKIFFEKEMKYCCNEKRKIEGERREAGLVREKEGKGRGDRFSDI